MRHRSSLKPEIDRGWKSPLRDMGNANKTAFKPPKRGTVLGEVSIQVLRYQAQETALLSGVSDRLHVTLPVGATGLQLKKRLHGMTNIPVVRIRLMFCGSVLEDGEAIPVDAFEETNKKSDDADVFRPRMFLTLKPVVEDETKPPSVVSEPSEVDEDELRLAAEAKAAADEAQRHEAELHAIREARTRELEEKLKAEHMRPADFDLTSDLEKIGCSHFIIPLRKAGFADEGAFARITDDVLQEHGLWVPRKARVRIVALADSIGRRLEVRSRTKPGALKEVERAMVTGGGKGKATAKLNTRSVEGLDGNFTTKASVTRAFEQKKKDEQRAKVAELDRERQEAEAVVHKDDPRPLDAETRRLIAAIRWRCEEDEFGLPVHCYRPDPPRFCCAKHQEICLQRRTAFLKERTATNKTALEVAMAAADTFGKGVCSHVALRSAALAYLRRNDYLDDVPETRVDQLLASSLLSAEEQSRLEAWASERVRMDCIVGRIPAPVYDGKAFAAALSDVLREVDDRRLLSIERTFTHLPYPRR